MNKLDNNLTFVVFTYNEETRLPYVIRNFINYGEVVVLDGGSTDKTKEITEKMGAKFYVRPESKRANVESQENLNFVRSIIKTDWVYWGYADNTAPQALVEKMVAIANENKERFVNIPMYTYLWGNTKNCVLKSHGPFLFRIDAADFTNNFIHGFGNISKEKEGKIFIEDSETYALRHFSTYDIHKFVIGHLRYAEYEAVEKYNRGEKFSALKMIFAMIRYCFIFGKNSYKNGTLGLIVVLNYAFFRLMAYTKLYELEHDITLEKIEANYSIEKEKLLKDFS